MTLSQAKQQAAKAGIRQVGTAVGWYVLSTFGFASLKEPGWRFIKSTGMQPRLVHRDGKAITVFPCR